MSKRRGARGPGRPRAAIWESTRREFVKGAGATALLLGALPRGVFGAGRAGAGIEQRTLFFNFSHLRNSEATHFLYLAGRKYRMTKVRERPDVLAFERLRNEFLFSVPDDQITHHIQGVLIPLEIITLGYTTIDENVNGDGKWAMTSMYFHIPTPAASHAYAKARELTPLGPLPLSGKRKRYKLRAALTEQDLREEQALFDPNSHAEALVGLHPDILSVEPNSGAHILANYVSLDSNTQFLGGLLPSMGPATPAGTNNMGLTPWATLQPLLDDKGMPFKKSDGILNQYYPDWDPSIDQLTAPGVQDINPLVKNDESLGTDITGYNLNDPTNPVPQAQLNGKLWGSHDGIPTVNSIDRLPGSGPTVTLKEVNTEIGLRVWDPTHTTLPDGRVQITLDNTSNWYLRWLGLWVQFLDPNDVVIPASQLPDDTYPVPAGSSLQPGPYPRVNTDVSDALFLGAVSNALAIAGIPVYPGKFAPVVNIPKTAATMRVLYTGIGQSGSNPQDPTGIYGAGIAMTVAFNYGLVGLFMAAGVSDMEGPVKLAVSLGGGALAQEIQAIIGTEINNAGFLKGLLNFAMGFLRVLLQTAWTKLVGKLVAFISAELFAAQLIDSIPVAGQIARAVSAVVGGIQLAETYIEIAVSPAAYIFDIVKTHDLSININPDTTEKQFPQPPPGFTLYYKVSYLFDNGTAHTRDAVDVLDPTKYPIKITFPGVPSGGSVNITIGFYMRQSRTPVGQNDWCAGQGRTGLVSNSVDQAPDLAITNVRVPIQSTTKYIHTRKTTIDGQNPPNHIWSPTGIAPPYTPPPGGQTPGLSDFNSITVRQGTSNPLQQGYVGYAWNAYSSAVNGCANNAPGLFDQMANLNTDAGNGGKNAQNGYVSSQSLCGFKAGVRMGYSLLNHDAVNIYLDTTTLTIRPVPLNPPSFSRPADKKSFGVLNFDSDRCLLHPAGHIVSISNAKSKIEVLKLPRVQGQIAAVSDDEAMNFYLARTVSAAGTRAGLITSPVAAAISPDGVILVLEASTGNNRIQAFDLGGNPVKFFTGQLIPYFLVLEATAGFHYLDMAVEFTGYIYVLSKDASNNHRLDIYHPTQNGTQPISSTPGVNAAKIAVDLWRSAYTLNYEVLKTSAGTIPGFTEPSVSLWVPTPPTESRRSGPRFVPPRV
jgi:hypothetical protein